MSSSIITSSEYSTSRGGSIITSSGYSTSTSTSSSPVEVELTSSTPSTTSSAAPSSTISSSQPIGTIIPAGAIPCPTLTDVNFLDCPDGEDASIAVTEESPVAGGDGFAYNIASGCDNAPVTVMLAWSNGTELVKSLGRPSDHSNWFDTPGNPEPCLFWAVATA